MMQGGRARKRYVLIANIGKAILSNFGLPGPSQEEMTTADDSALLMTRIVQETSCWASPAPTPAFFCILIRTTALLRVGAGRAQHDAYWAILLMSNTDSSVPRQLSSLPGMAWDGPGRPNLDKICAFARVYPLFDIW